MAREELADLAAARAGGADRETPLYMISVVAELLGVHPQTLRLYEREGFVHPRRTRGGTRLYSESDVDAVRRIMQLTRELGVNLAGVEVILDLRARLSRMEGEVERLMDAFRSVAAEHASRAAGRPSAPQNALALRPRAPLARRPG